jgi:hypothetical protein
MAGGFSWLMIGYICRLLCERFSQSSSYLKDGEVLKQLSDYQLLLCFFCRARNSVPTLGSLLACDG